MIPLSYLLILSGLLFTIGIIGVLFKRNTIIIFMSIELMLNSANLSFVAFSRYLGNLNGQVYVFFCNGCCCSRGSNWPGNHS